MGRDRSVPCVHPLGNYAICCCGGLVIWDGLCEAGRSLS